MKVRDIVSCLSDNVFVKIIQEDEERLLNPLIVTFPDELMEKEVFSIDVKAPCQIDLYVL